jgi:hypothetical protein
VPPEFAVEHGQRVIDDYALEIFEDQLWNWMTEEEDWPANRTPHVFRDWFDVEIVEAVQDLDDAEPLRDVEDFEDVDFEDEDEDEAYEDEVDEDGEYADEIPSECAWCGRPFDEDRGVVTLPLHLQGGPEIEPGRFEWPLGDRLVPALVSTPDSAAKQAGADIVFALCSEGCSEALRVALERDKAIKLS